MGRPIRIGNTSRDEYTGAFFGLGVAYDMIDDAPTQARIAALITRLLDNLTAHFDCHYARFFD